MIMEPAALMVFASVMLDFLVTTVQVNSQKPFEVQTGVCCWCFESPDFDYQSNLMLISTQTHPISIPLNNQKPILIIRVEFLS